MSVTGNVSNRPHSTAAIVRELFGNPELLLLGFFGNS